jgi:hypothetical protein
MCGETGVNRLRGDACDWCDGSRTVLAVAPSEAAPEAEGGREVEDAGEWRLYRYDRAPDGIVVMGNPPPRLEVGQYVHVFAVPRADDAAPIPESAEEWRAHLAFHRLAISQRDAAWRELERLRHPPAPEAREGDGASEAGELRRRIQRRLHRIEDGDYSVVEMAHDLERLATHPIWQQMEDAVVEAETREDERDA